METKNIKLSTQPPEKRVIYSTKALNIKIIFSYDDFAEIYKKLVKETLERIEIEMNIKDEKPYALAEEKLAEAMNNCKNIWEYTSLIQNERVWLLDEVGNKFIDLLIFEKSASNNSRTEKYKLSDGTLLLENEWIL